MVVLGGDAVSYEPGTPAQEGGLATVERFKAMVGRLNQVTHQVHLTERVYKIVLQKSIPAQLSFLF